MEFIDKVAVVTGGASGIGRTLVVELAPRGSRVLLVDIDQQKAQGAAGEVGGEVIGIGYDVSDTSAMTALAAKAWSDMGGVDLVFANAGVGITGPLIDADLREFDWLFALNVRGVWNTVSAFAKLMIDSGAPGQICVTASEHSIGLQHSGTGICTATKHAVLDLADVFRAELPPSISVSALCPGLVATGLHRTKHLSPAGAGDLTAIEAAGALLSRGKPAAEVARLAIEGVMRGEFFIPTNPSSLKAARHRTEQLEVAFARYAPGSPDADPHDTGRIMAELAHRHMQGVYP
ncbi:SDR family NAD(P)-dependent oxidoreductase [Burkholderia stagnalis]